MEDEFGWAGDRLESGTWLTTMAFDSSFFLLFQVVHDGNGPVQEVMNYNRDDLEQADRISGR